jgi:hypothetical protein
MGYLTNRRMLEHLEDLEYYLPEGWTYNTPSAINYLELEDFREVSDNLVFREMLKNGWSINQVLNGPGWKPVERDVIGEQKVAAESWAQALEAEVSDRYYHHPHESGAYVHTMWSRAADRPEAAHAIYAVDLCCEAEFANNFCDWVRELERKVGTDYTPNVRSNLGLASKIEYKRDYGASGRRTTRSKQPGSTLADKRRGVMIRRCKAVWV